MTTSPRRSIALTLVGAVFLAGGVGCSHEDADADAAAAPDGAADAIDATADADADPGFDVSERDVVFPKPHCPVAEYYVKSAGGLDIDLRSYCGVHSVYGSGIEVPAYYAYTRHTTQHLFMACATHDSSSALFILNRDTASLTYTNNSTTTVESKSMNAVVTRDDGIGGIIEGSFEGDATRTVSGTPSPVHLTGSFRACHLEDDIQPE